MAKPKVGDQIINDAGTCVTIVETPDDGGLAPGTVPEVLLEDYLQAGYRLVKASDEVPLQDHERRRLERQRGIRTSSAEFYVVEDE